MALLAVLLRYLLRYLLHLLLRCLLRCLLWCCCGAVAALVRLGVLLHLMSHILYLDIYIHKCACVCVCGLYNVCVCACVFIRKSGRWLWEGVVSLAYLSYPLLSPSNLSLGSCAIRCDGLVHVSVVTCAFRLSTCVSRRLCQ